MPVGLADRQHLMQRHDQPRLRQYLPGHQEQVEAHGHEVVEMHHIGLHLAQEFGEPPDRPHIHVAVPAVLEGIRQEQVLVLALVESGDDGARLEEAGAFPGSTEARKMASSLAWRKPWNNS